ncbi:MAG TPA: response regulator, partial [Anaerolineales bacterium]|nr:response regulator [Anaerolineales bacterium]
MGTNLPEAVDLPRVIEQAIGEVSGIVGDRPVSVVAEYPAHLPAVHSDPGELARVLSSLIALTMHRSDHGEIVVRAHIVSAETAEPGELPSDVPSGPWAMVTIAMRGNGLTARKLGEILENGGGFVSEGPGQLLSPTVCRQVLERHGGRLWADTRTESDSCIRVILPLRAAPLAPTDVSALRRALGDHLTRRADDARRLLLMVEEPGLRELLAQDLRAAGYEVVAASSGGEVMPLAMEDKPSLILLDILARDPTAFDIAMVLQHDRRTASIPVLFMTSVDDPQAGVRMGAVNFVVRRTGTGALVSAIEAALHAVGQPVSRVLVVEPQDSLRETMIVMIQSHGYRVSEASGPEEAVVLAERVRPDLVLVNARLAQERDYWLLRGLRQQSGNMAIFVLAEALSDAEG